MRKKNNCDSDCSSKSNDCSINDILRSPEISYISQLNNVVSNLTGQVNQLNRQVNFTGFNTQNENAEIIVGPNSTVIRNNQITFTENLQGNTITNITPNEIIVNSLYATTINGDSFNLSFNGATGSTLNLTQGITAPNGNFTNLSFNGSTGSILNLTQGITAPNGNFTNLSWGYTAYGTNLSLTGNVYASSFYSSSDYRIKDNIDNLNLNEINIDQIRSVKYNNKLLNKTEIGFIAHELQEYLPFAVNGEKDGENLQSINYNTIIALLVKEVQELKNEIKQLKK